MVIILSNLNQFSDFFHRRWLICREVVTKKFPPLLAYVGTLPCETSKKQAINEKIQGSVAIYLKCGGVVNNQRLAWWRSGRASDLRSRGREFDPRPGRGCVTTLGKLFTPNCLDADTLLVYRVVKLGTFTFQ